MQDHTTIARHAEPAALPLSRRTMGSARPAVRLPGYDPAALRTGILHLGCGAFHRGHQAFVTQRAIEAQGESGLRWGIASASLVRDTTPRRLQAQDGLYTLVERGGDGDRAEIVGAIAAPVHAPSDPLGLPARLADPDTRLVTLTTTVEGYLLEPATGRLQADHPDVLADLNDAGRPRSVVGTLAAGLAAVRAQGGRPPVILSCDNLSANGATLRRAVADFAALRDDRLAAWIEREVRFPNSMVDRIVPALMPEDLDEAQLLTGLRDAAPVFAEPFLQWVIEAFDGERPMWEAGGARFVSDVEPFETAKLRLLNGSHMLLAYLGGLAGLRTVAETMAAPGFAAFIARFMRAEQGPTLALPASELDPYIDQLLTRLGNEAIRHDVARIGRNGSAKVATRLMTALRENIEAGRPAPCTVLGIAAWIRWFALRDTSGTEVRLIDPAAATFKNTCETIGEDFTRQAEAFLGMEEVFGPPLPDHDGVVRQLSDALLALHREPVELVIARLLRDA
ncbi:mannitol dehydrogenase family protein [Rhizosaccharibacter radicis]|uniref:Mannitol dehydrogenase family protein n=1 Tax=Rhizosaccharibacter radicis TaxID=2782605 RepID=A0ABT1VT21_9PROT|nr:mannitol dehydrogenase family protein [Acetobacteraceae bacterium KSS12]